MLGGVHACRERPRVRGERRTTISSTDANLKLQGSPADLQGSPAYLLTLMLYSSRSEAYGLKAMEHIIIDIIVKAFGLNAMVMDFYCQ